MAREITNNQSPLGSHISRLFTPYYTSDTSILRSRDWVNETIDRFKHKPATVENCRLLKGYIEEQMNKMMERPQSEARYELVSQCLDKIKILESGIKLSEFNWRNEVVHRLHEDRKQQREVSYED